MMPSSPTPKIPLWIFILTDVALLLAGLLIAAKSPSPMPAATVFAVVACVIAGAIVIFVPLVSVIEREKNEALDDRQRALEALAATIATSAEQISIAAQGQHTIAELAQKNLQLAEQLPSKFQDKIAEFETLLNNAQVDEREELKKELARLRASESDRLEVIAEKVDKASRELAKLEAATQKHLAAAQAALAAAPETLTSATNAALARISSALSAAPFPTTQPAEPAIGESTSAKAAAKSIDEGLHILPVVPPTAAPFLGNIVSLAPEITVAPFRGSLISTTPLTDEPPEFAGDVTMPPFGGNFISSSPVPAPPAAPTPEEPHQRPSDEVAPSVEPVAESSAAPEAVVASPAATSPDEAGQNPTAAVGAEEPKPVKKRAPRKSKPVEPIEPALELESAESTTATSPVSPPDDGSASEFSQLAPEESTRSGAEVTESVISSDSATRLLVTAYIGIGNRLFIRGEGPGLSWEKGVPLQFVSIGKWRWETNDATAPVTFKLFKNDETECTALGSQTLRPEHQQEITATF